MSQEENQKLIACCSSDLTTVINSSTTLSNDNLKYIKIEESTYGLANCPKSFKKNNSSLKVVDQERKGGRGDISSFVEATETNEQQRELTCCSAMFHHHHHHQLKDRGSYRLCNNNSTSCIKECYAKGKATHCYSMNMDDDENNDGEAFLWTSDEFVNNKESVECSARTCRTVTNSTCEMCSCYCRCIETNYNSDSNNNNRDTNEIEVESSQLEHSKNDHNSHNCNLVMINIESSELQKQVSHSTSPYVEDSLLLTSTTVVAAASTSGTANHPQQHSKLIANPLSDLLEHSQTTEINGLISNQSAQSTPISKVVTLSGGVSLSASLVEESSLSDNLLWLQSPKVGEQLRKLNSSIEQQVIQWRENSAVKMEISAQQNGKSQINDLPLNNRQELLQRRISETSSVVDNVDNEQQRVNGSRRLSGCTTRTRDGVTIKDRRQVTISSSRKDHHLQNYAKHLSHLYKKNQAVMDGNNDFRVLLYNIICCLLIQDDQVLSTPSVNKMIDVIRAHLESASRFYSAAMLTLIQTKSCLSADTTTVVSADNNNSSQQSKAKSRSERNGSLSSNMSNTSTCSATQTNCCCCCCYNQQSSENQMNNSCDCAPHQPQSSINNSCSGETSTKQTTTIGRRRPVDFRRVSSVSFNDEQLIKDLCDGKVIPLNANSSSSAAAAADSAEGKSAVDRAATRAQTESPWRYEELAPECKHLSGNYLHNTSESSLDNTSSTMDLMNDSGIGTLYDFHTDDYLIKRSINSNRKRHSDVSDFRPKQRPAYITTDDCLSSSWSDNSSFYDGESSTAQNRRNLSELRPVDVAGRKAELEWTLNHLINLELKYSWLTSEDTLRRAIRKVGVPNEIRNKIWLILIEQNIGDNYDAPKLLEEAAKTIKEEEIYFGDEETQSILKQIELDVNRTMPGHKLFDDGAEGGIKLRRILIAYSLHVNRAIAYCQGFNFIVALLLSIFDGDEQKALRGFICIVDHIFPSKFYFDHYLTGARADQFLLADFICDQLIKNPGAAERKVVEAVASSITLNWFISLFHGAVPTLTRLTILDHFMLDGVKALFKFTMAILYLAFQITPPSSCDVFTTIRNTAKDMYDIKLLLSIVDRIKLPKDSYFAIRRSFYMVQSSFNSDQFYMQTMSNDASRQYIANKPLNVQNLPEVKPPSMSFISAASFVAHQSFGLSSYSENNNNNNNHLNANGVDGAFGPRVCASFDRSKVCIQNIGKMGRSHIKIMDSNVKTNERSLMSPLRNSLVIGISSCGKNVIVARQSSRRNFKTFREQDLQFYVHELCTEIFDGFYLEELNLAIILTYTGEVHKIDATKCNIENLACSSETLMLKDCYSLSDIERVKLRLASMDPLTNFLWIYVQSEDLDLDNQRSAASRSNSRDGSLDDSTCCASGGDMISGMKYKSNNPFIDTLEDSRFQISETQPTRMSQQRKILIIDVTTFDIFSAFTLHNSFGDLTKLRTSLFAFCQLANPMSNQFSSRIIKIGSTGRYEHLLSFSDVVDFMIILPPEAQNSKECPKRQPDLTVTNNGDRYSAINRLITRSISLDQKAMGEPMQVKIKNKMENTATLMHYYRSLVKGRASETNGSKDGSAKDSRLDKRSFKANFSNDDSNVNQKTEPNICSQKSIITSYLSGVEDATENNYIPVIMTFIFKNGKIALFEFTESYAIHTRESQLDRYDYSRVVEVTKSQDDFIITILTIFDKLIKVVI